MFKYINGYTLEKTMAQIKKYNNGTRSLNRPCTQCVYKNFKGNRCAIGCFIPDGHIALQSTAQAENMVDTHDLGKHMPLDYGALNRFQNAHDTYDSDGSKLSLHETLEQWLTKNVEL